MSSVRARKRMRKRKRVGAATLRIGARMRRSAHLLTMCTALPSAASTASCRASDIVG